MKAPEFIYVRAGSLEEAFRAKAAHGPDSRWLAGGQSLLAALAFRLSEPAALIDVSRIAELQGITVKGGKVRIGAGTTQTVFGASEAIKRHLPMLAEAIPLIAHAAIRNRGTIGGSLAFADPAAELPACAVALGATIVAANAEGERRIAARDFFRGTYETALREGELITVIDFPAIKENEHSALVELTRRSGDYAMAGVAIFIRRKVRLIEQARVVFFALGDRPVMASNAADELTGHTLDEVRIELAATAALKDIDPAGDLNGGPETKRYLAQVVLKRALVRIKNDIARDIERDMAQDTA